MNRDLRISIMPRYHIGFIKVIKMLEMMIMGGSASLGNWQDITATVGLRGAATVYYNGKLYVIGGASATLYNTIQVYTFSTGVWTTLSQVLPTGNYLLSACVINGLIYIYGGDRVNAIVSTLISLNPTTGVMVTLASGVPSKGHTVGVYNGMMYVYGGQGDNNALYVGIRYYNPGNNTWANGTTSGATSRTHAAGGVIGSKFYIVGGSSVVNGYGARTMDIYDLATNQWLPSVDLDFSITATAYATVGNKIYITGGNQQNPSGITGNGFVINTLTNRSTPIKAQSPARWYNSGFTDGVSFYSFGGSEPGGTWLTKVTKYTP